MSTEVIVTENEVIVEVVVTPEQEGFTYAAQAKQYRDETAVIKSDTETLKGEAAVFAGQAEDAASESEGYKDSAALSATQAEGYKDAALISANEASEAAESAIVKAQQAAADAALASASKDSAILSAQTASAKASAAAASAAAAEADKLLAQSAKTDAETAAAAADNKAQQAAGSATEAGQQKALAEIYKDGALSAKTAAETAKADAITAKNAAVSAKEAAISAKDTAVNAAGTTNTNLALSIAAKDEALEAQAAAEEAETNAETHATTATNAAAAAVVTKGQVEDLKGDVQTLKSETNTLKLAAETAKANAALSETNSANSEAKAETLANSIGLGGIFWPETEALRTRVIVDEGTFIQPMRIIDPQMDNVQGVNTPLLTNMAAYKTGKLYSIRPDDASGDFTCVRATTSTRINQLGESEVVPVNTPVIDWSTGSPLLIVTVEGELTLTTPASATKIVITIDGEDVEYNNVFPTLSLPVGSITKVIATVGGTEYDLLKAYLLRVDTASGTINEQGARDLKSMYEFLDGEGLLSGLELLYLSNAGIVQRTDGVLKYVRTAFDASDNDNDLNGSATASQQPRLVGGIAPNSKPAASNQTGESRKFTHATITVTGTYTVVKLLATTGKFANAYTEVVGGTITECTWTGNMKMYMVYAGTLTAGQRALIDAFMLTLYPEIESVDIGTQTWASRNLEVVATPGVGNVIADVTENGAVEKVTGGNFESGLVGDKSNGSGGVISTYSINTTSPISGTQDALLAVTTSGTNSSAPLIFFTTSRIVGKYRRFSFKYKVNSGTCILTSFYKGATVYNVNQTLTGSGTYTSPVFKVDGTDNLILYWNGTNLFNVQIDDISEQELNWSNATEIYDAVYAATAGDAATKEYAALKEAAMWCYYDNSADNGAIYGKLYNWYAAKLLDLDMQTAGFGWRVPTSAQFTTLVDALGGTSVAGGKLKMTGTDYLNTPNTGATNESGFTAFGGGVRLQNGSFVNIKTSASFVCIDTQVRSLSNDSTVISVSNPIGFNILRGFSIRTIKI